MNRSEHGGILSRLITILVLVCLVAGLYLLRHPILRLAGDFWVVEDSLAPSDAIIVLGDDNYSGDRAARAAELYRMGLAPRIVASGRMLRPYAGIAEFIEHDLESDGVPAAAIVRFPNHAANTREEAEALRTLVAERGWRRILVVTSNYHTRRSRFIFNHVMPSDITVRIASARDLDYDPASWWHHRQSLKLFLHESLGYVVAWWELRKSPVAMVWFRTPQLTR
ncbi:MAG: YdcF family protein [Candidatus Acidiferrales bacterium]